MLPIVYNMYIGRDILSHSSVHIHATLICLIVRGEIQVHILSNTGMWNKTMPKLYMYRQRPILDALRGWAVFQVPYWKHVSTPLLFPS